MPGNAIDRAGMPDLNQLEMTDVFAFFISDDTRPVAPRHFEMVAHLRISNDSPDSVTMLKDIRRLFIATVLVLEYCVGPIACIADENDWESELVNTAPALWDEYSRELNSRTCRHRYISYDDAGKIDGEHSWDVFQRDGEMLVHQFEKDGSERIVGLSSDYGFRLLKRPGNPVSLDRMTEPDWKSLGRLGQQLHTQWWWMNPTWLFREPLKQVINQPYFQIVFVDIDRSFANRDLLFVEFEYPHLYEGPSSNFENPFNWVQRGKIWFDLNNHWATVRQICELLDPTGERSWREVVYEFPTEGSGTNAIVLPVKRFDYHLNRDMQHQPGFTVHTFKWDEAVNVPDKKQFRISHFGFPEPSNSSYGETRWPAVAKGIGLGTVCLVMAWVFRRWARNANS